MRNSSGYIWITLLLIVLLLWEGNAASHKSAQMMQLRISRQTGNYNNYQVGQMGAYSLRGGASSGSVHVAGGAGSAAHVARPNVGVGPPSAHGSFGGGSSAGGGKIIYKNAARPVGVGAYTSASGRPAYGPTYGINTGGRPQFGVGGSSTYGAYGPQNLGRPQQNAIFRGAGGRPGPGTFQG